jgi:crossover junction endodeoxyribonuclease RuvC
MNEEEGHIQLNKFVESISGDSNSVSAQRVNLLAQSGGYIYVGIDPGATGAIAFLHPLDLKKSIAIDIPTVRIVTGRKTASGAPSYRTQTDLCALWDLFVICKPLWESLYVVIEQQQPMPRDTALTGFTVHDTLRPMVWKRMQGLVKKDKEAARLQAQKLFPGASLKRKKDHNRAEALLIAHAYRNKDNKTKKVS